MMKAIFGEGINEDERNIYPAESSVDVVPAANPVGPKVSR